MGLREEKKLLLLDKDRVQRSTSLRASRQIFKSDEYTIVYRCNINLTVLNSRAHIYTHPASVAGHTGSVSDVNFFLFIFFLFHVSREFSSRCRDESNRRALHTIYLDLSHKRTKSAYRACHQSKNRTCDSPITRRVCFIVADCHDWVRCIRVTAQTTTMERDRATAIGSQASG